MGGKIYTGQVDNAQDCSCLNIVLPSVPGLEPDNFHLMEQQVCPSCRCVYQRRNLTVIYAVVVFLCILISGFSVYLLMTQIICPRFIVISMSYKEQRDDEIVMEEVTESPPSGQDKYPAASETPPHQTPPLSSGMNRRSRFPYFNLIWHHQSQWQQDLDRQQRNIYTDHTMLNWLCTYYLSSYFSIFYTHFNKILALGEIAMASISTFFSYDGKKTQKLHL